MRQKARDSDNTGPASGRFKNRSANGNRPCVSPIVLHDRGGQQRDPRCQSGCHRNKDESGSGPCYTDPGKEKPDPHDEDSDAGERTIRPFVFLTHFFTMVTDDQIHPLLFPDLQAKRAE